MATLVPVQFEDGTTIYIEGTEPAVVPGTSSIEEAGAEDLAEKAVIIAQDLSGSIREFCGRTVDSLRELGERSRPTKATIEFGLNVSAGGNVYVVKGTGQASVKITAEWELTRNTQ